MQILIVDDSKAMRTIIMRALRQVGFEDLVFREASNGSEALEIARETPPDLILVDWNMPEMNGIDFLKALRAEGSLVKLGFVTSESDPVMREQAFQAGALFMISKPFSPEALRAALQPVLA